MNNITRRFLVLASVFLLFAGFVSYKTALGLFSDTANSDNNIFTAAATFPSPSPPIANHLVINEVLYDTSSDQNISGQGGSNRGEFLEIFNPTVSPVNVNGWIVEDDNSSETLPNVSIPAGGFLILTGATEAEFETIWFVPVAVVYAQASNGAIGNGFDNSGDLVRLKSDSTTIVDQISWGGNTTILNPAPPDVASGHSLERDPDGVDTNTSADFVDRTIPTPGT